MHTHTIYALTIFFLICMAIFGFWLFLFIVDKMSIKLWYVGFCVEEGDLFFPFYFSRRENSNSRSKCFYRIAEHCLASIFLSLFGWFGFFCWILDWQKQQYNLIKKRKKKRNTKRKTPFDFRSQSKCIWNSKRYKNKWVNERR